MFASFVAKIAGGGGRGETELNVEITMSRFKTTLYGYFLRKNKQVHYILSTRAYQRYKDIPRWRDDVNFMFEWQEQYLHENIKFISSS